MQVKFKTKPAKLLQVMNTMTTKMILNHHKNKVKLKANNSQKEKLPNPKPSS